jgi:hypothetical protein
MSHSRAAGRRVDRPGSPISGNSPSRPEAAVAGYLRSRDLPKLLPLWPREIEVLSQADHLRLLAKLRKALRAERQRGLRGHWAYDLARHAQLLRAYRAETADYLSAPPSRRSRK